MSGWILASERLPTKEDLGDFSIAQVVLQCNGKFGDLKAIQRLEYSSLVFIGGNKDRPMWMDPERNRFLENSAWFVSHWRPIDPLPQAV
jgi:hypothetical protein